MKNYFLILFIFCLGISVSYAQNSFDEDLANKLGADEYGMKKYIVAFLYRGDQVDEYSPEEQAEIQRGHMDNITKLAEEGKMVLAGPFFGNDDLRGLFFFAVETIEEAEALTKSDPAIEAGVLKMDLKEWYGSAALGMLMEISEKISKKDI